MECMVSPMWRHHRCSTGKRKWGQGEGPCGGFKCLKNFHEWERFFSFVYPQVKCADII